MRFESSSTETYAHYIGVAVGCFLAIASGFLTPLRGDGLEQLIEWKKVCEYNRDEDFLFPSVKDNGDHPIAPDMVLRRHIRPALKDLGIQKRIGWHSFRHGLGTMLRQQGVDLKTAQELLRHANARTTMELYQKAISLEKRAANAVAVRGLLGYSVLQHPSAPQEGA